MASRKRSRPVEEPGMIPTIALGIKSQDGNELYFRYSLNKKIQKMLKAYCTERNMEYVTVTFLHDGKRINPTKTPAQIGLKDGDVIDAMLQMGGGGFIEK